MNDNIIKTQMFDKLKSDPIGQKGYYLLPNIVENINNDKKQDDKERHPTRNHLV